MARKHDAEFYASLLGALKGLMERSQQGQSASVVLGERNLMLARKVQQIQRDSADACRRAEAARFDDGTADSSRPPRRRSHDRPAAPENHGHDGPGKPILIVDDEIFDRELLKSAIRHVEVACEVQQFGHGRELMDYLQGRGDYALDPAGERPGLILLDWNMPGMNGSEVLKELQADPDLCDLPVVVISGILDDIDAVSVELRDARAVFKKPRSFNELVDIVRGIAMYCYQ